MSLIAEAREKVARWMIKHSFATGPGDTMEDLLAELGAQTDEMVNGLIESVKLQSHYAELLNMHDGGRRLQFASAREWMDRLAKTRNRKTG